VTSANEVMFSVCFHLAELRKNYSILIFTKFGRNVAQGPRKKRLHFGGNPDHFTLGLGSVLLLLSIIFVLVLR